MYKKGSLVNVGLGMTLGAHITPISRSFIEKADVVFVAASDSLIVDWVKTMNTDVRALDVYYKEGTSRAITYEKAINAIMNEVRNGKQVCGAFYGHPGVFSWAPHRLVEIAKEEGFVAHMEPGISAEDCLYSDIGIDPGDVGCSHYGATQFMCHEIDYSESAYLVLWQVSLSGDQSLKKFSTNPTYRQLLVDKLLEKYPEKHKVILYECAVLPIDKPRIDTFKLINLSDQQVSIKTTLIIPPINNRVVCKKIIEKLAKLDSLC